MKVGDYVRFDYHKVSTPIQIAKITETHYDSEDDSICYSTDIGLVIDESNLVKEPSSNIIDICEVGDLVKYNPMMNGYIKRQTFCKMIKDTKDLLYFKYQIEHRKVNFVSIVTKQQFEKMEYKL